MTLNEQYFSNLYDLILCMTRAVDLVSPEMTDHHQQVAYLSYHIADALQETQEDKRALVVSALLHDVGSLALQDRFDFLYNERANEDQHAIIGGRLFAEFPIFNRVSKIITYHHTYWNYGKNRMVDGMEIPYSSHILHLADRIAVHIHKGEHIISQMKYIEDYVRSQKDISFEPRAVDAFLSICYKESLWLNLTYRPSITQLISSSSLQNIDLTLDEVVDLTHIFSQIIDFRSPFTAMHSAGVAATAVQLAKLCGFSEDECKMMDIAGNLHDIGKLAIPVQVLEKQDKLDPGEFDVIRSHSFYTYRLLRPIRGFENITEWAANHHEKLSGNGYPFHFKGPSLSYGARIMAVADIFAAITEDRPYRAGLDKARTVAILQAMVNNNSISSPITQILIENYEQVNMARKQASDAAVERYGKILLKEV